MAATSAATPGGGASDKMMMPPTTPCYGAIEPRDGRAPAARPGTPTAIGRPQSSRRRRWTAAAALLGTPAALVAVMTTRGRPPSTPWGPQQLMTPQALATLDLRTTPPDEAAAASTPSGPDVPAGAAHGERLASSPAKSRTYFGNASGIYLQQIVNRVALEPPVLLSCADYDDDAYYPLKPGGDPSDPSQDCEAQDALHWCDACLASAACVAQCGSVATAQCPDGGRGDFQFIQPCMWQLVAQLPATCADAAAPYPPLESNNLPPRQTAADVAHSRDVQFDGGMVWGCALHALCGACAAPSEPSTLNPYCLAVILYNMRAGIAPDELTVFEQYGAFLDLWCDADVLRSVEDGTLAEAIGNIPPQLV